MIGWSGAVRRDARVWVGSGGLIIRGAGPSSAARGNSAGIDASVAAGLGGAVLRIAHCNLALTGGSSLCSDA